MLSAKVGGQTDEVDTLTFNVGRLTFDVEPLTFNVFGLNPSFKTLISNDLRIKP